MNRIAMAALVGVLVGVMLSAAAYRYSAWPATVAEVGALPARELAVRLLGPYLGRRVIEMERHEYESSGSHHIPQEVVFYTQPMLTWPRINGICATDVITVEFDWYEHDDADDWFNHEHADSLTPLKFNHIEAKSRFKAFPVPPGEPGSSENERLQAKACANFKTARDAFAAPSAGDAQWLAAMEQEYSRPNPGQPHFAFACQDFADATCANARAALPHLALTTAQLVESVDCPPMKSHDQVNYCYRLTFLRKGTEDPEWKLSLVGGMADGSAPVQIRMASLEHLLPPVVLF